MSLEKRYNNQLRVQNFDESDQLTLAKTEVLVVGAGGLGCPVVLQLAALGVGNITIIDDDQIELHNLNRQTLYTPADIGKSKALVAAERVQSFNPHINIHACVDRLTSKNAEQYISGKKLVLDCTDNIPGRYAMDDVCKQLGVPMIFGGVRMLEGQYGVFNYRGGTSFADMFPKSQHFEQIEDCSTLGTFVFACHLIGSYQVTEAFKILLNRAKVQAGKVTSINLETGSLIRVGSN